MIRPKKGRTRSRRYRNITMSAIVVYVATYFVLSRMGYDQADKYNMKGFYFVLPLTPVARIANNACNFVFFPLLRLEQVIGTGRTPASDPIEKLSLREETSKAALGSGAADKAAI